MPASRIAAYIASASLFLMASIAASAAEHLLYVSVDSCDDTPLGTFEDPYCDIQSAIDDYQGQPMTVYVAPGVYQGSLAMPNRSLRIISTAGPLVTHIVGVRQISVVYFFNGAPSDSEIAGFTIRGGGKGVDVSQSASPTIRDCIITDNESTDGAGARLRAFSGRFIGCHIHGNTALDIGGGVFISGLGSPVFESCVIENNRASHGAGIYASGLTVGTQRPTFLDCTIRDNVATGAGGGISFSARRMMPEMKRCVISGNRAKAAAGIDFYEAAGTLTDCTIEENIADEIGGGLNIKQLAHPSFYNCTIQLNRAELFNGGAMTISAQSYPYFENCKIRNNYARNGGGVYAYDEPSPRFYRCAIENNTAEKRDGIHGYGGGLALGGGNCFVEWCTISGNRADSAGGIGHSGQYGLVSNCYIEHNQADSVGGGILCNNSSLLVRSSLIHDNESEYGGGGVYAYNNATPRLENCTIVFNRAGTGGGVYSGGTSAPVIINSILWRDAVGEVYTEPDSKLLATYSTIAGGWPGEGNLSTNPNLGQDFRLLPGSNAIDSGIYIDPGKGPGPDLDGHARKYCANVDRGAYEFGYGDYDCNQVVDLSDFAFWDKCMTGPLAYMNDVECFAFDSNSTFTIDLKDFAAWSREYTEP